jgi:hypothetical protein
MKKQIFIYLFVFTLLILIFQLVNSNKVLTSIESDWRKEVGLRKQLQDSVQVLQERLDDEVYFSLIQNEGAQVFFPQEDLVTLESQLVDAVYETNLLANDQKLVPFAPMGEGGFLINKVKVLNHKWLVADFTDGTYWGELFVTYQKLKNGSIRFTVQESFLYPLSD